MSDGAEGAATSAIVAYADDSITPELIRRQAEFSQLIGSVTRNAAWQKRRVTRVPRLGPLFTAGSCLPPMHVVALTGATWRPNALMRSSLLAPNLSPASS